MILAGIDEAGYGPLLGPLVVGCCAFEVPDGPAGQLPCLWTALRRSVGRTRDRKGAKLHINDSKLVYSPAGGLRELERSVLTVSASRGSVAQGLDEFLKMVAGPVAGALAEHPWYAPSADERFPLEMQADSIRVHANALKAEMAQGKVACCYLSANVLPERQLNRLLAKTHNKSSVLFTSSATHLQNLLTQFGQRNLVVFCDRQGGREHYGQLLRLMFEDWSLEVVSEQDGRSEYCLCQAGHRVRVIFQEKAETQCLSVAMASMLSKYLREALMRRFNAWWASLLPQVTPTAGYYTDGMRFLKDIQGKRQELGITDQELVRMR